MSQEPNFNNSYRRLADVFFEPATPASPPEPRLVKLNEALAETLDLDIEWLESEDGLSMLSGRSLPAGAEPIALAYAGHQFGGWSPRLGDGRAILLGEVVGRDGARYDIQLKGSGRTPFSRNGDGKAGLGPVMREYIVSEAMAALGVPTTRALAAVLTGERIFRQEPQSGAVLTRVAHSHVRVGTFQYFYSRKQPDAVKTLADYVVDRHYPEAKEADNRYRELFTLIAARQAELVATWMTLGFIHGVMNTDNVQIAGETLDYGPCAFMDTFHPRKVFSSIDRNGRYAWGNQPDMAQWNLTRLAEAMLSLFDDDKERAIAWAEETIGGFGAIFVPQLTQRFQAKLGLSTELDGHGDMLDITLGALTTNEVDFTLFFRQLTQVAGGAEPDGLRQLFNDPAECDAWLATWRHQYEKDPQPREERLRLMQRRNPIFIPRNHRIEEAIQAGESGDFAPFHRLVTVLARATEEQPEHAELERAPEPDEVVQRTFCGT